MALADRLVRVTPRLLLVAVLGGGLVPAPAALYAAEDGAGGGVTVDPATAARVALDGLLRHGATASERLAAAAAVLAAEDLADGARTLLAAADVAALDDTVALWLVHRVLRDVDVGDAARDDALAAWPAEPAPAAGEGQRSAQQAAARAGARWLLGERSPACRRALLAAWPPAPAVAAALTLELGWATEPDEPPLVALQAAGAEALVARSTPTIEALDAACSDRAARMQGGLDRLVDELGAEAVPVLLGEVRRANALPGPDGRTPRAARAVIALGRIGDARVRPELEAALAGDDGWLRTVAASALGDLGDPGAAPALAWHLSVLSDAFRARDRWDYPGAADTPIAAADWPNIDYYVIDGAACEALLRLGVPRAAGWLIDRQLDPRQARFRIRVLQDATDALRRHVPTAPVAAYIPDAGIPQRQAAFEALAGWWHDARHRTDLLATRLDETSPSFRSAADALVQHLSENDARRFIIGKAAIALVGPPMTPSLIEALGRTDRPVARSEIALALGLVGDLRAVPALIALQEDPRPMVRARACVALGAYARTSPEARATLLAGVHDAREDVRVAALGGLVGAPRCPEVAAALGTVEAADRDGLRALVVARLVQEGPAGAWDDVAAGLAAPTREERHAWWDLVRRGLGLPAYVHDAQAEPTDTTARHLDRARATAAWQALPVEGAR